MKIRRFAEFYRFNPHTRGYDNVLGSDSVFYLDGRWSLQTCKYKAIEVAEKRRFDGFRIARGTHTNPFYLTAAVQRVSNAHNE